MIAGFLIFLFVTFIFFLCPGLYILSKANLNLHPVEKYTLSVLVGFILFTVLSYTALILKIAFLPFLLGGSLLLTRKELLQNIKALKELNINKLIILLFIFLVGIAGQMAIIAPSGISLGNDLVFWSAHGHDGAWHIALMEEIKRGFPLQNPVFAGERLVNYHFFSDITPAFFNKYFDLNPLDLYFRFFPLLYSFLLGSAAFSLGRIIGKTFSSGIWTVIFTYFAGSFGYIVTIIQDRGIGGEGIFWSSQIQSTIGNPPQIIASILVLTIFILLYFYIKEQRLVNSLMLILLISTLPVFKVYGGVVIFLSLGLVGIWQLIKSKRVNIFKILIPSGLLSALLYLPNSSQSQNFLIYEPWWFIRTMIVSTDKLNWLDLELRRQTYIAENNWKRVIQIETTGFLIFLFGNLGIRFLGFWYLIKKIKQVFADYFLLMLLFTILTSLILPLIFLQKGVASNTIQFLQYFLLLMGIIAGVTVSSLLKRLNLALKVLISSIIIAIAVPTQVGLIYDFYKNPPTSKISKQELEALNYISQSTPKNSVLLTPPYNQYLNLKTSPPSIWDWFDTSYVAAFSKRRVFFADTEQVDIMGYEYQPRQNIQKQIYLDDSLYNKELLSEKKINYLYFPKVLKPKFDLEKSSLKKIYENQEVEVWSVN
ncbi:hypothetical protein HYW42_02710 [Candidatus Daviesbacteria bacterium]|nr:hypothetical protein [Candidatus Daviesbacteria bacterium]